MHLHGHTFQLRGRRIEGAHKDTGTAGPMEAVVVAEFEADSPRQGAALS